MPAYADPYSYIRGRARNNISVIGTATVTTAGAISANSNPDLIMASSGGGVYTITVDSRAPVPTQCWLMAERSGSTVAIGFVVASISGQVITVRAFPNNALAVLTSGDKVHIMVNCNESVVSAG